jgi:transcriptional regulator with XRE-family HTH domain
MPGMTKRSQSLADQLRAAIDASGKTRYRLAQECEIDESALAKFYHGTRSFPINRLERLAEVLGYEITLREIGQKRATSKRN